MKEICIEVKDINPLATFEDGKDSICIWREGERFRHGVIKDNSVVPSLPISKKTIEVLAKLAGIGAKTEPLVPIKYCGTRDNQKEPLYGTGWWAKGQVKNIPMKTATKLLRHPEFRRTDKETEEDVLPGEEAPEEGENTDSEANLQAARDLVANMDIEALKIYAAANFGGYKLHHNSKLETARNKVTQLIDQYGVPE